MITFKNVEKTYIKDKQQFHALKNINLTINKGDIFGLIGYSGAGKSTLIRLINLLELPTSGEVSVAGVDIHHLSTSSQRAHKKKIGMIFQHFNLLETKTVAQNIAMPLILSKVDKKEINKRVDAILDYVELSDKKYNYPSQLSGGQKQRVGIARALVTNPDILLCDEATSALDPETTLSILKLLKQINEEQKITIVLVTHAMDVVAQTCNRVAVMESGEIIEQGNVLDIFSNPQKETTQKFVGSVLSKNLPRQVINQLDHQEDIYRLEFLGKSAQEPIVNKIILAGKVEVNFLFANMKEIGGVVLGSMFVQILGKTEDIKEAIDYLKSQNVRVTWGIK